MCSFSERKVTSNPKTLVRLLLSELARTYACMEKPTVLAFSGDQIPISVLAAARVAGIDLAVDDSAASGSLPFFRFSSGSARIPLFRLDCLLYVKEIVKP